MPRTLADAVALVESAGYYRAERYEPLVFAKLSNGKLIPEHAAIVDKIKTIHRCTMQTAMVIYSTSYGAFQIMGFNIWGDLGVACHKIDWCDNTALQQQKFTDIVTRMGIAFDPADIVIDPAGIVIDPKALTFALHYNGPGNVEDYAKRLVATLSQ